MTDLPDPPQGDDGGDIDSPKLKGDKELVPLKNDVEPETSGKPESDQSPAQETKTSFSVSKASSSITGLKSGQIILEVYKIEKRLGGGGMGQVYRAWHKDLKKTRAIKVINPELMNDERMEKMFIREAEALALVNHPAVVKCQDPQRSEGQIFLIMEDIAGPSLEEILKSRPLSVPEIKLLAKRLGEGLAAAHAKGVVHRDLSPDNILLPNSDPNQAKLIDFGIAHVEDPGMVSIIQDFKGKLQYASPEQFGFFDSKIGPASDVFSLGLVLAHASIGMNLDMGGSTLECVEKRRHKIDLAMVPAPVRELIEPMLELDPANRGPFNANHPDLSIPDPVKSAKTRQLSKATTRQTSLIRAVLSPDYWGSAILLGLLAGTALFQLLMTQK